MDLTETMQTLDATTEQIAFFMSVNVFIDGFRTVFMDFDIHCADDKVY